MFYFCLFFLLLLDLESNGQIVKGGFGYKINFTKYCFRHAILNYLKKFTSSNQHVINLKYLQNICIMIYFAYGLKIVIFKSQKTINSLNFSNVVVFLKYNVERARQLSLTNEQYD